MKNVKPELDEIANKLRSLLRKQSLAILDIGNLLIASQGLLDYGEWMRWLHDNFDVSYRTARRYIRAAEYARKCDTVADFSLLSPSVLYRLSNGFYSPEHEAAILAKTNEGVRIDVDRASGICSAKRPLPTMPLDDAEAILDRPPPELPQAEAPPLDDFILRFEQAIKNLKELQTKPLVKFVATHYSAADIDKVASFLQQLATAKRNTGDDSARSGGRGRSRPMASAAE
jgi:hypothetical protein